MTFSTGDQSFLRSSSTSRHDMQTAACVERLPEAVSSRAPTPSVIASCNIKSTFDISYILSDFSISIRIPLSLHTAEVESLSKSKLIHLHIDQHTRHTIHSQSRDLGCFMFHASCFMLHVSCFMLHVSCFMLHDSCFMLHASCFMFQSRRTFIECFICSRLVNETLW